MIGLIITIAVLGLIVWLITTYIPMANGFKQVIYIVALVCLIFILLNAFGLLPIRDTPVPQIR